MFKIKAIATLYVEKNEQGEAEQLKTVKLQVGRSTTVREFVTEAMKKANLGPSFGCVDVQYFSKKFEKFLDVGYDEIVKDGREYNVKVIWSLLAIKRMESKTAEVDATIMKKEDDLSTCKIYEKDHVDTLTCSTVVADEKVGQTELSSKVRHPTYAEVVSYGDKTKDIEVAKQVNVDVDTFEGTRAIDGGLKVPKQIDEINEDIEAVKNDANSGKELIVTFSEQLVVFGKPEQKIKEDENIEEAVVDVPPSTAPPSSIKRKGWFEVFSPASTKR